MQPWAPRFLEALAASPNVAGACRHAGIGRRTAYDAREADPEFAAAWDDALDDGTDNLVGAAYRRAFRGTRKPVIYRGEPSGSWVGPDGRPCEPDAPGARFEPLTVREHSDTLTIFLLKSHRPAVYRETIKQEHSGEVGMIARLDDALAKVYGNSGGDPGGPA